MGTLKINKKAKEKTEKTVAYQKDLNNKSDCGLSKLIAADAGFVEELTDKRSENSVTYRRNDRTCRQIITATPMRYRDENGELQEICTNLVDSGEEIIGDENVFKIRFNKSERDSKIFELKKGDKTLTLKGKGSAKAKSLKSGCKCEKNAEEENAVTATLQDGTEVQYLALNDRIKENIIVREKRDCYEYDFTLEIGDMTVEEGEHNSLLLKDKESGETEFTIPAPYMYDSNNVRSDDVSYEIEVSGGELAIKVKASEEFINAPDRAFPVTIDPQITIYDTEYWKFVTEIFYRGEAENSTDDRFFELEETNTSTSKSATFYIYKDKINLNNGLIEKVELQLYAQPGATGYFKVDNTLFSAENNSYIIDITEKYRIAYETVSVGLVADTIINRNDKSIFSFYTTEPYAPKIIITYVEQDADSNAIPYKAFSLTDKSESEVNLNDGSLASVFTDIPASYFSVPLSVSHIFRNGAASSKFGNNWGLNIKKQLKLSPSDNEGTTAYLYTDEFGNKFTFTEKYYYLYYNKKIFIPKNSVTIDDVGNLSYEGKKVYKVQNCLDYTLIPKLNDFKYSEFIDQRTSEQAELEDFINSYRPTLIKYVLVSKDNAEIASQFTNLSKEEYLKILNLLSQNTNLILITQKNLENLKSWLTDKTKKNDIDELIEQAEDNLEVIKSTFLKYFEKEEQLQYIIRNTPSSFLKDGDGYYWGYSEEGNLVLVFDGTNNYVSIIYNSDNAPERVMDNLGYTLDFKYVNGLLDKITDSRGRTVNYSYNGTILHEITFADGETLTFSYFNYLLSTIESDRGKKTALSYDASRRVTDIQNFALPVTIGKTVEKISNTNYETISGLQISYSEIAADITYLEGNSECYTFDSKGRTVKYAQTDLRNNYTTADYTYNEQDGIEITLKQQTNGGEVSTSVKKYNELNNLVSQTEDWRKVTDKVSTKTETTCVYDADDVLTSQKTTVYTNTSGEITSVETVTNYMYNGSGQLILTETYIVGEEQISGINYEERVYNDDGNVVKCIKWNSLDSSSKFYTESVLEENGQVTADIGETGEVSAEYDYLSGASLINTVKYANGGKLGYGYDPRTLNVTSVTQSTADGEANTTDIAYTYGLPVEVKSGRTVIDYFYDNRGRKTLVAFNGEKHTEISYADYSAENGEYTFGGSTVTQYNGDETVVIETINTGSKNIADGYGATRTETVKINGVVYCEKQYDRDDKLTKTDYVSDSFAGTYYKHGKQYTYNADGNLTKISATINGEIDGGESYYYDDYGVLTRKTVTGAVLQSYTYSYKANASKSLDYVSVNNYKYYPLTDVYGRTTGKEIYDGENKIAAEYITYRKVGDRATNMPATVWFGSGAKIADSIKYKYDSCGNIIEIRENGHIVAKYAYDSLNRLIREDNKVIGKTALFTYDQNGNITERCEYAYTCKSGEELDELECTHYSYDYDGDRLVSYNGEEIEYDNAGNPTTYRGRSLKWKYGKWLTDFGGYQFQRDCFGRTTHRYDTSVRPYTSASYYYDENNNLIRITTGVRVDSGPEFIYDGNGLAGLKYQDISYFYRKDVQGNIIAILDSTGNVVVKYVYDAWGNHAVLDADGNDIGDTSHIGHLNPFRYRGYFYDAELGLYFLQTRYYDPETGRFISQDSIDYADPETINGLNLYAYCANNPVMNIDPTGTSWKEFFTFMERIFTGFADLCNFLVKKSKDLFPDWRQFHKIYPKVSHRQYDRENSAAIAKTSTLGKIFGKIATVLSLLSLGIDIALTWSNNAKSGSSTWVTDSIVDTLYIGGRYALSWGITSLCSTLIPVPILGTFIGIVVSIAVDYFVQWLFEDTGFLKQIKYWAAGVGQAFVNGWNNFWSFAWI